MVQRILKEIGLKNVYVVPEQEKPDYTFATVGEKTLYAQIKDDIQESLVVSDTITITQPSVSVVVGFNNAEMVGKMAKKFPNQKYALVDSSIDESNVRSISFQEHEGSFLVGAIAAIKTKNNQRWNSVILTN